MKGLKFFVSGPLTCGDTLARDEIQLNVNKSMDVALALIELGHFPFVPHLYQYLHDRHSLGYEDWMLIDMEWLQVSEAVFRIDGNSLGADREVRIAEALGKPIFTRLIDVPDVRIR